MERGREIPDAMLLFQRPLRKTIRPNKFIDVLSNAHPAPASGSHGFLRLIFRVGKRFGQMLATMCVPVSAEANCSNDPTCDKLAERVFCKDVFSLIRITDWGLSQDVEK